MSAILARLPTAIQAWYYPGIASPPSRIPSCPTAPHRTRRFPALAPGKADARRRSVFRPGGGGAPPACGARKWPSSPASASTGTSGWNRAAPSARRSPPSMRWRARCASARPSTPICAAWRATPAGAPLSARSCRAPIRRLVESLNQPAYITGRRWDVLAWNDAAEEIFALRPLAGGGSQHPLFMLTKPATRRVFGASWAEGKRMVAQFRATHDLWAGDPAFVDCSRACAREPRVRDLVGGPRRPRRRRWPQTMSHPNRACCISSMRAFRPTTIRR